jgi:hypothetical protein
MCGGVLSLNRVARRYGGDPRRRSCRNGGHQERAHGDGATGLSSSAVGGPREDKRVVTRLD